MATQHIFPLILDGALQAVTASGSTTAWNGLTSYIEVDSSSGNETITIADGTLPGTLVTVIKKGATNTITVNPTTDFAADQASVALTEDNEMCTFFWNNTSWRVFNQAEGGLFNGGTVGNAVTFGDALKLDIASTAAVVEQTNRTTGVTLNQVAGVVTTDDASLGDGSEGTLTVTNSVCTATSVVLVSPGTNCNDLGGGAIEVTPSGGSFTIVYKNVSGGAVTTAQTFRFVVLNLV
jgi:hypothetical protein